MVIFQCSADVYLMGLFFTTHKAMISKCQDLK